MVPTLDDPLTSLTQQALQATENGRWDQVALCIARRETLLAESNPSPALAVELVALDRVLIEKVRLARDAVGQVLSEVVETGALIKRFATQRTHRQVGDRVDRQA